MYTAIINDIIYSIEEESSFRLTKFLYIKIELVEMYYECSIRLVPNFKMHPFISIHFFGSDYSEIHYDKAIEAK